MPIRSEPTSGRTAHGTRATRARADKPTGDTPSGERPAAGEQPPEASLLPVTPDPSGMIGVAASDIGSFIRSQREAAQVSIRQLAERAGVSNPYLSQIERGLRKPSAEVLGQIAKALRLSAEVLYVRAGILEQRDSSPIRDAVLTAPELTERQREVLLEIYESFCANNTLLADTVVDVSD